jgi:hypothetical protein
VHSAVQNGAVTSDQEQAGRIRAAVNGRDSLCSSTGPLVSRDKVRSLHPDLVSRPPTDRIFPSRQEPREMRMKALHTSARPPHTA